MSHPSPPRARPSAPPASLPRGHFHSYPPPGDGEAPARKRPGPKPLEREAKAAAQAADKVYRREHMACVRSIERKMADERVHALNRRNAYNDVRIDIQPHSDRQPSSVTITEIQRILDRPEPPVIDFEYFPPQPFLIPTRDPYIPGKWQNRSGFTQPRAVYIVRRVTSDEMCAHEWDLYGLRRQPGAVWRKPTPY